VSGDGFDTVVKGLEVERLDEVPDGTAFMVAVALLVERSVRAAIAVEQAVTRSRLQKFMARVRRAKE
jgi:hypothetical protein